jgi:hypothetical protein
MPFNYLGSMRRAQWKAFRDWTLNERRNVSSRLKVINAELRRIGRITVFYQRRAEIVQTPEGAEREIETVTEVRESFTVSQGSSLEKLVQAYIAQGGSPLSISMWLMPDEVLFSTDGDPNESTDDNPNEIFTDTGVESTPYDQPHGGVIAPRSTDSYGPGGRYVGGLPTFPRGVMTLAGKYFDQADAGGNVAIRMDHQRRWVRQELGELEHLEQRIIRLMDLREQLIHERDNLIQQAVGGSVEDFPLPPDPARFARNLHVSRLTAEMDGVFYETNTDGEPDFTTTNRGTGEEPTGISLFDTLFDDPEGIDEYAVG